MEGPEVVSRLQVQARELQSERQRYESEANDLQLRVNSLLQQRGSALLELARHYLPVLERETVEGAFAETRGELLNVLAQRDAHGQSRTAAAVEVSRLLADSQSQLSAVTARLNELVNQRQKLEEVVASQLKQHPKFPELSKLAEQASVALKRNQSRVAELKQIANEKLPPYERSSLFQYLYRRRFSTPEYQAKGWVRELDQWVAGLVNYPEARRGYEFLRRAPKVLAEELNRRQADFEELLRQLKAIENEAAQATGLTTVRQQGIECGTLRDRLVANIDSRQRELHAIQTELQELSSNRNRFYQDALTKLQRFLSQANASILAARARQSPEPHDDQIVASINAMTIEIDQLQPRISEASERSRVVAKRLQEVQQLISRCQQQNFDSTRSYFEPSLDLNSLLSRYSSGQSTSDEVWRTMQSYQRFYPAVMNQISNVAAEAMSNRLLMDLALQATATAIQVATQSGSSFGSHRRRTSSAGNPDGNTTPFTGFGTEPSTMGGAVLGGGTTLGISTSTGSHSSPSSVSPSSNAISSSGSFTSGEGF